MKLIVKTITFRRFHAGLCCLSGLINFQVCRKLIFKDRKCKHFPEDNFPRLSTENRSSFRQRGKLNIQLIIKTNFVPVLSYFQVSGPYTKCSVFLKHGEVKIILRCLNQYKTGNVRHQNDFFDYMRVNNNFYVQWPDCFVFRV